MAARETIVITGSSGFIGAAVAARLAGSFRVVGLDRDEPPHAPPNVESIGVDLTSDESVGQALDTIRARHGDVHAVARRRLAPRSPSRSSVAG